MTLELGAAKAGPEHASAAREGSSSRGACEAPRFSTHPGIASGQAAKAASDHSATAAQEALKQDRSPRSLHVSLSFPESRTD